MDKNKDLKDTPNGLITKDLSLTNHVFNKEPRIELIFKKTERIVTAIYLVTNFFSIEEPIKWDIRQVATKLLRSIMSLTSAHEHDKETRLHTSTGYIIELNALFDIASRTGLVSRMNYNILHTEIEKLSDMLCVLCTEDSVHLTSVLSAHSFEVQMSQTINQNDIARNSYKTNKPNKGHSKPQPVFYGTVRDLKDKLLSGGNAFKKTSTNSNRREQIISEVTRKGEVSVKDISSIIKNCSEKTLQRELLALVSEGVLSKTGERRWSRYSLKK